MTLEEIDRSLPNGFHDTFVLKVAFELQAQQVTMDLEVWVGDVGCPADDGRETLRPARLELLDVAYLVVEAPDPTYRFAKAGSVCVDLCDLEAESSLPPTRVGDFAARFFVSDWNSFVSLSARDATLVWTGEPFEPQ